MKSNFSKTIRTFLMLIVLSTSVFGQGLTTASMRGTVFDDKNEPLPGATVLVERMETGAVFGASTDLQGVYRIPNMAVGGPYTFKVSFIGYQEFLTKDIYLSLGQTFKLDVRMSESAQVLSEMTIVGSQVPSYNVIDGNRTGAETFVSSEQIDALPTVSRDLTDFTRLTPQASVGDEGFLTVAGINNRYNAISIDGAVNNDVFGLAASGTNGGQTGASPISMDVIEQFQISLAPYDVRQSGFAGANINAVTKSGTNKFKGTAYYLFRNENLAGKTPTDDEDAERTQLAPFTSNTMGLSIGGPIIKNKLFFFVNAEQSMDETPLPFSYDNYVGNSTQAQVEALATKLQNDYGYNAGTFLDKTKSLESTKLFGRLDWNISNTHRLMLRHSYTKSVLEDASASSSYSLGFSNNYMYMPSVTNSTSVELKSNWDDFNNSLLVTGTFVRDDRDPKGVSFPAVRIYDGDGSIYFGSEAYSTANQLDQDILTITDNFQIYKGDHTITVGTNNEFASVYNLFMRKNFGEYRFGSYDAFMNGENAIQYERGYSLVDDVTGDGSAAAAEFNMAQLGLYAQDEWRVNDNLKVTAGIRFDMPLFLDDPVEDTYFNENVIPEIEAAGWDLGGAQAGSMPKSQVLFSPRIGFNLDVFGDEKTQLRGGVGIFTSRLPLVWPAGSYTNNGVAIGGAYVKSSWGYEIPFNADWNNQYDNAYFGITETTHGGQVDLFTEDFKYPQMFRANMAVDQKLPWGMVGTLEFLYTKTLNNVLYYNVNVDKDPVGTLKGADNRPVYSDQSITSQTETAEDDSYSRVMLGTNTSEGYTYNFTAQLQKPFDNGLTASVAYTFGKAMALNDATSSQNSSQWRYMENVNGLNNLDLSYSDFDLGHRVVAYVSYSKEYIKHLKSTVSIFYNGQSGRRFSYVYNDYGDLNGEGENAGNLIYVPASASEIELTTGNYNELQAFINDDPYLSDRIGDYAERNGARSPFSHIFDFKFVQDIFVNVKDRKQTLQLTFDVFNVGNLINSKWGRRYYTSYGTVPLLSYKGDNDEGIPTFSFSSPDGDVWNIDDSGINSSRWQAQIGIRYIF